MIAQPSFDGLMQSESGNVRADAGMNHAENALDLRWRAAAQATITQLAATGRAFSADDVRDRVGDPLGSPAGIGPLFRAAAKAGEIRQAGWTTSKRPEAHSRPLRTWRGHA